MVEEHENSPFLSIGMVVKNEEEMIRGALESVKGADELVVIDTGSTDKTIDICREYTDKIYTDYEWKDDFAEAKNLALSRLSGQWSILIDADCRLEPDGIAKLKKMAQEAPEDVNVLNIRLVPNTLENTHQYHKMPKLFRMGKGIHYKGKVHESVNELAHNEPTVSIVYLYSPNHYTDPDRNIRILLTTDLTKPRNLFYLGREYYERKRYDDAIDTMKKYFTVATWTPEIAEAWLVVARCYWFTQRGDEARESCLRAINCNPDFREALRLMAVMHHEPWKSKWQKIADQSTNKDVLFVRV